MADSMSVWRESAGCFCLLSVFLLLGTLCFPAPARAHPHAWISLRTSILVNEKGEAVAIREHWLFDKAYSAYATHDFNPHKNGKFTEADLLTLAKENLSNLKDYHYFTTIEDADGKAIEFGEAKDISSDYEFAPDAKKLRFPSPGLFSKTRQTQNSEPARQIAMTFTVPLRKPVDLRAHALTYRIYDPTYYVDMAHEDQHPVTFISETGSRPVDGCHGKPELPKVDQAMIFQAAALDKNATAPKDLGYYFSEKVTLSCSQPK